MSTFNYCEWGCDVFYGVQPSAFKKLETAANDSEFAFGNILLSPSNNHSSNCNYLKTTASFSIFIIPHRDFLSIHINFIRAVLDLYFNFYPGLICRIFKQETRRNQCILDFLRIKTRRLLTVCLPSFVALIYLFMVRRKQLDCML